MNDNNKTSYKCFIFASIALVMAIAVPTNAVLAYTSSPYLNVKTAVINSKGLDAVLYTGGNIPKGGSDGAFGYGILTRTGDNPVLAVATTQQGFRDNAAQGSGPGPALHTHFVQLGVGITGYCGTYPEIQAITLQEPGRVVVVGSTAIFNLIPSSFAGTDALTGKPLTLTPGHNVQNVVSFRLAPVFSKGGALQAVCVTDISPAQQIIKKSTDIIGDLINGDSLLS